MDARMKKRMRDWLIRFYTARQRSDTFAAGEWAGRKVTDCINELDDNQLEQEWRSYQC